MGKGLPRSHSRGAFAGADLPAHIVKADAFAFVVDGATGVGFGTAVVGGLPEGNILFLGAVAYMTISGPGGDAGLVDDWEGDFGVGTTPASDGTLTAGDVDIVPSTPLAAATAEVGVRTRGAQGDGSLAGQIFDNTDGSLEVNVNVLVDDVDISADGIPFTATGEVFLMIAVLGDD